MATGQTSARRATLALSAAAQDLNAQFIVVAQGRDPGFVKAIEDEGAEFVSAPSGCSRAEMCDLGMTRVSGTIVAVRDDVSVGNAAWIDAYRRVLPKRELTREPALEAVVMDTQLTARAQLADRPATLEALEVGGSSIEIAAAV